MAPARTRGSRQAMSWTERNLAVQGYCLTGEEAHRLRWALRLPTGLCLMLVLLGLALQSAVLLLALVPIGAFAGFTARHPFDYVWNGAVRHVVGAPGLPPNPTRRFTAAWRKPQPIRHSPPSASLRSSYCCSLRALPYAAASMRGIPAGNSPCVGRRPNWCRASTWRRSS